MDEVRDKLVDMIHSGSRCPDNYDPFEPCDGCRYLEAHDCGAERLADYLIANGVTVQRWHPVEEGLPPNGHDFEEYLVIMCTSHFPTSSFDPCDAPYSEEKVTTAKFDIQQSLWHFENGYVLNALIMPEDAPLNGDCVTHWAPMPHIP